LSKTNDNWFYNSFIILDQSNKLEQNWKATDEYRNIDLTPKHKCLMHNSILIV